jgi:hypothetical protein
MSPFVFPGVSPTTSSVSDQTAAGGAALSGTASFGLTSGAPALATVDFGNGTGPQVATVSGSSVNLSSINAPTVPGSFTTGIQILNTALAGGLASVAFAVSTNTAPTATVQEVDFSASNTADFHPVTDDISGVSYTTAQWLNGVSEPICYTRSGTTNDSGGNAYLTATVTMNVTGFPGASPEVKASINGVDTAPVDPALNTDDTQLTATVTSSSVLPNTIARTNETISWFVSNDGGMTWISAGPATVNRAYIVNGISLSGPQVIEAVLNVGCVNASGMTPSTGDVVSHVWDYSFQKPGGGGFPKVNRASDNKTMRYWGPISSGIGTPGDPFFNATATLIKDADGRCGAWARFFIDVLGAQGIQAYLFAINPDPQHKDYSEHMDFPEKVPIGLIVNTTVAQGGNASSDWFQNHAVVELTSAGGGAVYDPSYGNWFPSQQAWRNYSLWGIEFEDSTIAAGRQQKPAGTNVHDVEFKNVPYTVI